jgi:hypothetical protein
MSAPSPAPRSASIGQNASLPTPTQSHVNGVTSAAASMAPSGGGGAGVMSGSGGAGGMSQQNLNQIVCEWVSLIMCVMQALVFSSSPEVFVFAAAKRTG